MNLFYFFRNRDPKKEKTTAKAAREAAEAVFAQQTVSCLKKANYVLVYGGDGTMLDALREIAKYKKIHPDWTTPITIGFNYGDVGYLMNNPAVEVESLIEGKQTQIVTVNPLEAFITDEAGRTYKRTAFNDVVVHGDSHNGQSAHIDVFSEGAKSCHEVVKGDGVIVATPMGSSAYYRNVGGEAFGIGENLMGLRPICDRNTAEKIGGIYPATQKIVMNVLNQNQKRPAYAQTDNDKRINNVAKVEVVTSQDAYPIAMGISCPARMRIRG